MKDKIEQILRDNLVVSGSGLSILGTKGATNKLIELMCYEIVKAYHRAYADFHGELSCESFTAEVEGHYLEEFDGNGELLSQSIEKVKTEQT